MAHRLSEIGKRSLRARQRVPRDTTEGEQRSSDPRPSIQVACASEIGKWCQNDEERAMGLLNAGADRVDLEAALLVVNQCLASRTSVLSSECLSSLAVSYMEAPRGTGVYIRGRERDQDRDRARDRFRQRDGPLRPLVDSEDSWEQPPAKNDHGGGKGPLGNKQDADKFYYWNKHGFGRADEGTDGRQIRSGDSDRSHPHHHRRDDDGLTHPIVIWLVILPFFALGVFVAVRRAIAFYRQRQLTTTHHSVDARDYEPLHPRRSERQRREEGD